MYRIYQQTVTRLLLGYFRQYISEIEADFQLSLWGGDVVLNDLNLRLDVINKQLGIDAPFSITRGFIKELKIHIPWSSITTTPVEIVLSLMELTLSNNQQSSNNSSRLLHTLSNQKYAASVDHNSLNLEHPMIDSGDEENDKKHEDGDDYNQNEINDDDDDDDVIGGGFLSNLLQRIIANASIKIKDLSLKYVDDNCQSEATLKIGKFETVSTTLNWQPRPQQSGYDIFLTPWKLCHRSSSFENVSLFLGICARILFLRLCVQTIFNFFLQIQMCSNRKSKKKRFSVICALIFD